MHKPLISVFASLVLALFVQGATAQEAAIRKNIAERLLRRYARERAAPTWAMGEVTDGLLRLFSHDSSALRELRNRGLTLVNHFPSAKRWLASQALGS